MTHCSRIYRSLVCLAIAGGLSCLTTRANAADEVVIVEGVPVPSPVIVQRPVPPPVIVSGPITTYYGPAPIYAPPAPVVAAFPVRPRVAYMPVAPVAVAPVAAVPAPVFVGRPVIVRPKVYVAGQPVRNFFRAITP